MTRRLGPLLVGVVVLASLAACSGTSDESAAAPSPTASSSTTATPTPEPSTRARVDAGPCTDAIIIGLRGQGQSLTSHRGVGAEVDGVATQVERLLVARGESVSLRAVRHRSRMASSIVVFQADVADGKARLAALLDAVSTQCPRSRVAVIGFSQGAQIAHEELAERPDLTDDVHVLALMGDPRHDATARIARVRLPGGTAESDGSLGAGPALGDLTGRTVEACVLGDVVCNLDPDVPFDYTIHKHAYEKPENAELVAEAIVRRW